MWNLDDSDEEVFFGQIRLKEVRKSIFTSKQRETLCTTTTYTKTSEDDNNRSIKIIESHSTPNITSICTSKSNAETSNLKSLSDAIITPASGNQDPTVSIISTDELGSHLTYQHVTNDSFLCNLDVHNPGDKFMQIEELVNELSLTPEQKNEELDNTLDVVNYILNNGPNNNSDINQSSSKSTQAEEQFKLNIDKKSHFESKHAVETKSAFNTPPETDRSVYTKKSSERKLKTPNTKTPFKSPGIPVSHKTLTPFKKQFEHVLSPVASYINNGPVVPLLKNVKPTKKPLHGTSFIPQPIKNLSQTNVYNKENNNLPSMAYRSAKETKVINLPVEHKLPHSQWAKHVAGTSLQKGVVMRHIHREKDTTKKQLFKQQQEDSFDNLTLNQADLSVCTQKSAVKKAH